MVFFLLSLTIILSGFYFVLCIVTYLLSLFFSLCLFRDSIFSHWIHFSLASFIFLFIIPSKCWYCVTLLLICLRGSIKLSILFVIHLFSLSLHLHPDDFIMIVCVTFIQFFIHNFSNLFLYLVVTLLAYAIFLGFLYFPFYNSIKILILCYVILVLSAWIDSAFVSPLSRFCFPPLWLISLFDFRWVIPYFYSWLLQHFLC